jgi:hypothetical protein
MLDFFRGTLSADAVLDFLDHLPRTSAYHTAVAEDEDLAKRLATEPPPPSNRPPPLSEFGPEVQVLAELRDLIANLIAVTVKAHGGKPSKVKPYPRPETAVQRERRRRRLQQHRALVARVLPDRRSHDT